MGLLAVPEPGEVRIGHMKLDAPRTARATALASLDRVGWPASGPGDDEWLIIRHIEVDARGWDLGARASSVAYALARDAVSGWMAGAAGARAVRFSSLADLIACLSRDIAQGRAPLLWYWQTWLHDKAARSNSELWCEQIFEMPQVIRLIAARGVLREVLAALPIQQVPIIMTRIRQATGWPLPALMTVEDVFEPDGPEYPIDFDADWMLAGLVSSDIPASDTALDLPLAQLLAVVALWDQRPGVLRAKASAVRAIRQVIQVLLAQTNAPDDRVVEIAATGEPLLRIEDSALRLEETVARAPEDDAATPTPQVEADGWTGDDASETIKVLKSTGAPPEQSRRGDTQLSDYALDLPQGFVTHCGGLFYLINALNRADVAKRILASPSEGWLWLWQLGRTLGLEPDEELLRFMADRLECRPPEVVYDLAAPDGFAPVPAMLERQYISSGVWDKELLLTPTLVSLTASHLDLHMRLEDARPDVRQVGLDRDPGWVDWLGRIVTFHFGAVSELIRVADHE